MSIINKRLEASSTALGEYNDCTVRALAVMRGWTYAAAHTVCQIHGRKERGTMEKDVWLPMYQAFVELDRARYFESFKTAITLTREFDKRCVIDAEAGIGYLVEFTCHVAVYWDGQWHDWITGKRKKHVKQVWRIYGMRDVDHSHLIGL